MVVPAIEPFGDHHDYHKQYRKPREGQADTSTRGDHSCDKPECIADAVGTEKNPANGAERKGEQDLQYVDKTRQGVPPGDGVGVATVGSPK